MERAPGRGPRQLGRDGRDRFPSPGARRRLVARRTEGRSPGARRCSVRCSGNRAARQRPEWAVTRAATPARLGRRRKPQSPAAASSGDRSPHSGYIAGHEEGPPRSRRRAGRARAPFAALSPKPTSPAAMADSRAAPSRGRSLAPIRRKATPPAGIWSSGTPALNQRRGPRADPGRSKAPARHPSSPPSPWVGRCKRAGGSGRRTNERRGRTRSRGSPSAPRRSPATLAAEHSGGRLGGHRRCLPQPGGADCAGSVWPSTSRWARIRNHWSALGPEPRAQARRATEDTAPGKTYGAPLREGSSVPS